MTFSHFVDAFVLGRIFFPVYKEAAERMCQRCEPFIEKGSKILDLGCGRGTTAIAYKNYFQAEIFGTDITDQRIFDFPFKITDGKKLPFPDNSFDVILINYVLHHAASPLQLLREAKRVSKNKIIVNEDLEEKGLAKIACWLHKITYKISVSSQQNPIKFYNKENLEELFNRAGLKIIFQETVSSKFKWIYPAKYILFVLEK